MPAPIKTTIRTACSYDCPDACGLLIEREGKRVVIRGDPDHPITRGFTCTRMQRHLDRLRDPARLQTPLLRRGEAFVPIGWEEALGLAARKLEEVLAGFGPAAVVLIGGGGSLGLSKELVGHFFRALGPVTTLRGGACGEAGEAAQALDFGDAACHDTSDLENARAVVLWGKNSAETGPHLIPFVRRARARGAPAVLIEVRPTETDPFVDRVIRVTPSGDGFLALAVLRRLHDRRELDSAAVDRCENFAAFERMLCTHSVEEWAAAAGVPLKDVEFLSNLYTRARPVSSQLGWGLQRRRCGGSTVRCLDALGLLSGNVGIPGGGVNFTSNRRRGLDGSLLAKATGRTIATPTLANDLSRLADPPARFVYIFGANPVTQLPDSAEVAAALRRSGFVVVSDAFFTDTAAAADLVLPVRLLLEEDDIVGSYGHHHVAVVKQALEPPAGARADVWIAAELQRRLGRPQDPLLEDPEGALHRLTAAWRLPEIFEGHCRNPTHDPVPFAGVFPTPLGKARLPELPPEPLPDDGGYPLNFLTPSTRQWQTSLLSEEQQQGPVECRIHPRAPGAEGFKDGDLVKLASPIGSLRVRLRFDTDLRRGLCVVYQGGWNRFGRGVNSLVQAQSTDLGEGTAFYDQRVRLER